MTRLSPSYPQIYSVFSKPLFLLLNLLIDLIRNINDPEHPLSLEELNVVQLEHIAINEADSQILVAFTPTIPHCSMATLIGLCIKIRLQMALPPTFWIDVKIREGSHVSEDAINRQLADKERVCAALENPNLYKVVQACIEGPKIPGIVTSA